MIIKFDSSVQWLFQLSENVTDEIISEFNAGPFSKNIVLKNFT